MSEWQDIKDIDWNGQTYVVFGEKYSVGRTYEIMTHPREVGTFIPELFMPLPIPPERKEG